MKLVKLLRECRNCGSQNWETNDDGSLTCEECGTVVYPGRTSERSTPETFRSRVVFEDEGLCDYWDTIENAVIQIFSMKTGEDPDPSELCGGIDDIREQLCEEFGGCYPSYESDDDSDEAPCYLTWKCPYGCAPEKCPMRVGNCFPEFNPSDETVEAYAAELIRCVKCNKSFNPDSTEVEKVIEIIADTLKAI